MTNDVTDDGVDFTLEYLLNHACLQVEISTCVVLVNCELTLK